MTPKLLDYLCDPVTREPLSLADSKSDAKRQIVSGVLKSRTGASYPVINGIPRFIIPEAELSKTVESFGNEWNYFNV